MIKTFVFDKIDGYKCGLKNCIPTVTIECEESADGLVFSASCKLYNHTQTQVIENNFDYLYNNFKDLQANELFSELSMLWKNYNNNDCRVGTIEQEKAINYAIDNGYTTPWDILSNINYLKSINLFEVKYNGGVYKYGTGFIYNPIPTADTNLIKSLFD
jgi:hypothetical protein